MPYALGARRAFLMLEAGSSPEALARQIARLTNEGLSIPEIAAALDLTQQRAQRIASRFRVRLPRGGVRRDGATLSPQRYAVLKDLADSARISPSLMASRIVAVIVDEGIQGALRRLGREARPKRAYARRGEG
jgi:DNA-binding transcriptional MerR regulator